MKKKTVIRIISFFTAGIVVLFGMLIREKSVSNDYKLQIQNEYSKSLAELNSQLNSISVILEKTRYVTAPKQISALAAQLFSEATLAKNALLSIPTEKELETVNRFLSQVGNYALSISKNAITGGEVTEEQRNNLKKLSETAKSISDAFNDTQIIYNNSENLGEIIENKISETADADTLATTLTELEENLTDYLTLIYDGPYSDHILTKKPLMTSNAFEVSRDEALTSANEMFGIEANLLQFDGMENGKIEAYRFAGENLTVTVSKKGGYVVYMRNNRIIESGDLKYEKLLSKAKEFLKNNSFVDMKETYYYIDEGVCVINFAYLDGQTLCYTDLIKVGVATDNGEIVFYEAAGYLTNHTDRSFVTPELSAEEASAIISSGLNIEKTTITLIPTDSAGEVRCYEFLCKSEEGDEILVYVNVITGIEEQILILLKSDNGVLVK